jgi:hypothetical protein
MLIAFMAENPLEHIVTHPMIQRPLHLPGKWQFLAQGGHVTLLDSHIVMMMLAAFLLILLVPVSVRRRRAPATPSRRSASTSARRSRSPLWARTPTASSNSSGPSSSSC